MTTTRGWFERVRGGSARRRGRTGLDQQDGGDGGAGAQGGRWDALLVVLAFAAVYVIWGSTYLAILWAVETIPPVTLIGARCLIAGGVLYGFARLRGGPRPDAADWRGAFLAGTLLFVTGQTLLAWAETRIASGPAALLVATEPLFIVLLGWAGGWAAGTKTRGARPTVATFVALALGFLGVALVVLPSGETRMDTVGALATLGAAFSWSVGMMRARSRPGFKPAQTAGMQLLAAGVVLTVLALVGDDVTAIRPSARSLAAFAYLVICGSIITYGAYVWLLERVGPQRLSTHAYVNPVVAVALGGLLGGEPVTGSLVAAMGLIVASVVLLVRRERPREARRPAGRRASLVPRFAFVSSRNGTAHPPEGASDLQARSAASHRS